MSVAVSTRVGDALVRAIAAGDQDTLLGVLDPAVDFRALTPGRAWEASTAADAAAIVLGRWFAAPRRIEATERIDHGAVGARASVAYRFLATTPDGEAVIEQQAYFDVVDDRIVRLQILCSGFCPVVPHGC